MHLKPHVAFARDALGGGGRVREVRDEHTVEPEPDARRLAFDLHRHVVPGVLAEVLHALGGFVDAALRPRQVNRADGPAGAVVERHLVALAVLAHAQEDAAIDGVIKLRLQLQDEIAVLAVGDEEAAFARRVLVAGQLAADDFPLAADIAGRHARMNAPTFGGAPVEERRKAVLVGGAAGSVLRGSAREAAERRSAEQKQGSAGDRHRANRVKEV